MSPFRPLSLLVLTTAALAMPSGAAALPMPTHQPAPLCQPGAVPQRGVVVDDGHARQVGVGHSVHGQGLGYGHACGGTGGDDTSGGGVSLS